MKGTPVIRVCTYLLILFVLSIFLPGCDQTRNISLEKTTGDTSLERVKAARVLVWGTDLVENIPYTYEDPKNPGTYIGFEMDIATKIAKELGVQLIIVSQAWDTLIPELQKGSFDMAMDGIEDTEDRRQIVLFSDPYYVYSQQITVKKETTGINRLEDLHGKKVATLAGTAAEDILRETPGIQVLATSDIGSSYWYLETGKVDAVLLDTPIAAAYAKPNPKLKYVGESFGNGRYIIAFKMEDKDLRDAVNQILDRMKKSGELRETYTRWNMMDPHQKEIDIQ